MHLGFIHALFSEMARDPELAHLTRFIDSNGHLGAAGWGTILGVTDSVMLDIKAFDSDLHLALTKRNNARSLASACLLFDAGKLFELRFLMIPEHTDSDAELRSLIAFVKALGGPLRIRLNGFRNHGVRGDAAKLPTMAREKLKVAAAIIEGEGLGPVVLPAL